MNGFSADYHTYLSTLRPADRDAVRSAYRLYLQSGTAEAYYFYREVLADAKDKYQREMFKNKMRGVI